MEIILAKTDWAVIGTWAGVIVALAGLIVGTMLALRKHRNGGDVHQTQRAGGGSTNYQAGGDLTVKDEEERRSP